MISIIVATDMNDGIGYKDNLLVCIPEDLKRFRKLTENHTVIMGRKTFESLNCKPLPNRRNIILTKNPTYPHAKNIWFDSKTHSSMTFIDTFFDLIKKYENSEEEIFVIGGASIYNQFLPYAKKIYATKIFYEFENVDSYFKFDLSEWEQVSRNEIISYFDKNDMINYEYVFTVFERRNNR